MPGVVGRDAELFEVSNVLSAARRSLVASAIVLEGPSGIGKTSVLEAVFAHAASSEWLAISATAHPMQAAVPGAIARRLTDALLRALGPDAARYTAGLDEALADKSTVLLDETLVRLVEGVLIDHALLLGVDDAQWLDAASADTLSRLMQNFADRQLAFVLSRRPSADPLPFPAQPISILPVRAEAAAAIVREHYPQATAEVLAAIVGHAAGNPIDLVGLARAAQEAQAKHSSEIESSSRTVVARQLDQMNPREKELLQLCALIGDPIDYRILAHLFPDEAELSHLLAKLSARYLVQDGADLRFVHASVSEGVRSTIPIEIPYRRRILGAMTAIAPLSLEDHERIITQAAACANQAIEREYLLRLASETTLQSAFSAAATAYARALAIAPPQRDELIAFYVNYAMVLNAQGRMAETKDLVERAMREATLLGLHQKLGRLVGLLIIALARTQGHEAAIASYRAYQGRFDRQEDRLQLDSIGIAIAADAMDAQLLEETKARLLEADQELPDEIAMRMHTAIGLFAGRSGDYTGAIRAFNASDVHARSLASANRHVPEVNRLFVDYMHFGNAAVADRLREFLSSKAGEARNITFYSCLSAGIAVSEGRFESAQQIIADMLSRQIIDSERRRLLSISSEIAAWTQQAVATESTTHTALQAGVAPEADSQLLSLGAWWAAANAKLRPQDSIALAQRVIARLHRPLDAQAFFTPISLSLCAQRTADRSLLEACAALDFLYPEQSPWHRAHAAFARGYAREALAKGSGVSELIKARDDFRVLGATYYAGICERYLHAPSALPDRRAAKRKTGEIAPPSNRELEIMAYVAQGKTNREIAEAAFLSERTVEAHLSNIFNKLGVSSRTQVATKYLELANPRDPVPS